MKRIAMKHAARHLPFTSGRADRCELWPMGVVATRSARAGSVGFRFGPIFSPSVGSALDDLNTPGHAKPEDLAASRESWIEASVEESLSMEGHPCKPAALSVRKRTKHSIRQVEQARFKLPTIMVERELDTGNSSETRRFGRVEVLMRVLNSLRWIFGNWNSGASKRPSFPASSFHAGSFYVKFCHAISRVNI